MGKLIFTFILISVIGVSNITFGKSQKPSSQSHAPRAQEPGSEKVVTLDELTRLAVEHNPGLQASRQTAHAARLMVSPAQTLPNPTFSFQNMGDLIPPQLQAGDPSSGRTYTVEQEIPFPGKLGLKGKIASSEADVQDWNHALFQLQLKSDVKQAYYDLYLTYKSIETVKKDKDLLLHFVEIAETLYEVGRGIQQDVVKAQVEVSKLTDRLINLEQQRKIAEARINNLLYRPIDLPVGRPAEFAKAQLKRSLEDLLKLATPNSPLLQAREREIERDQFSVQLAQKEFFPDFALGFNYVGREDNPEMYGIMFKASLPIYFWRKESPALKSAKTTLASSRMTYNDTVSAVGFQIREAYETASTSDELTRLYYSAIVPQARLSLESALAGYETGGVDFLTLIDNLVTLLEYELKYYESLTTFQKALARMEPFVGVELTR